MKFQKIFIFLLIIISYSFNAQEFSKNAIKIGFGAGVNEGSEETGLGFIYSLGFQKAIGSNERFRVNTNLRYGEFSSNSITDTRENFYRITSLGINANYDVIKYKSISLFIGAGAFLNYTRGMLGTGGELINHDQSRYFYKMYSGGTSGLGIRISSKKSRLAYEIKPLNVEFGNNDFLSLYPMLGIDIKL